MKLTLIKVETLGQAINPDDLQVGEYILLGDSIIVTEQVYIDNYGFLCKFHMSTFFKGMV